MSGDAPLLKTMFRKQAPTDGAMWEVGSEGIDEAFLLTPLERQLLGEALLLLAHTRSRALQLATEFNKRRRLAGPDVRDFELPVIIDLQRRLGAQQRPSIE